MGNCWGLFRRNNMRRHIVLILIGLDNAGKTKTVNNLAGEKDDKVLPTVGFKAVNLIHKDTPVTIYDLGGGPQFREIWCQYYSEVHGVIFVIDSSDFSRLDECKTVLEEVLSHDKISGKPVLVLANKQDKSGALDDIDVVEKLNIEPLVNKYRCPTLVESYAATHLDSKSKKIKIDPGLRKGYHWLLNYIVRRYGDINLRVQTDIHSELERRKRMLNRASNRASQTFTAVSDDIATQTGFDNPNFGVEKNMDKSNNVIEKNEEKNLDMSSGLILVKSIRKPNSVDSTITIESVEDSDNTSRKPKLSPLFGASNTSTSDTARIELEPRSEFRKLSPVIRKIDVNNIDFKNRPQSSPTCEKSKTISSKCSQEVIDEDRSRTWHPAPRFMDPHMGLREIVIAERDPASRTASSDIAPSCAATLPMRPASASKLIRRQLEISGHRRRLSLRYMQRNKTSPERASMMIYEQKVQRHLDKGDCEKTVIQ